MISIRQRQILKAIVEEYVKTAEPVGSKALLERTEFAFNVSPATIRNDMAYLEELGYIVKPHTSSGRVPSEEGYRLYVKEILSDKEKEESFPMLDEIFERDTISKEQAIKESMALITDLTNYASIAMGSTGYNAKIKKLQFISLTGQYGVILMVTDKGNVESKKIIIPDDISVKDMDVVMNLLNDLLHDCPISKIDEVIRMRVNESDVKNIIDYYDDIVSSLVRVFTNMAQDKYFLSGQGKLLSQPEFQNIDKARSLINAIEKREILKVVNVNDTGITVKIGSENQLDALQNCTVITVPYEDSNGEQGAIAIFGPTRMDYQKIIPLLEYIVKNIKKII